VISDLYLSVVLLLAALHSDGEGFLDRHSWVAGFFPRRTAGLLVVPLLFVAVVSGFAGLYVGTEVFRSSRTPFDALYISSFTLAFTDYSPKPGYGQLVVLGQLVSGVLCWWRSSPYSSHGFPLSNEPPLVEPGQMHHPFEP
jgi:hypothetical protein